MAAEFGVGQRMIEVRCALEFERERLARCEVQGAGVFDAGPAFCERSVARHEPMDESECLRVRREAMPEGIEMAMVLRLDAGFRAPACPSAASARLLPFEMRRPQEMSDEQDP